MFGKNYAQFYDLFNKKKPYEKEIDFVYKWAGFPSRILDVGCGTASYWKYYPEQVSLFGIENSPSMRIKSDLNIRLGGRIVRGDITNFDYKDCMKFDCVTALFNVINYIPKHDWWKNLPLDKGGYFIFDIWDKRKVDAEGFRITEKKVGQAIRTITPVGYDGKKVDLKISVKGELFDHTTETSIFGELFSENHRMYIYNRADIEKFCGRDFKIVDTRKTRTWQSWFKLIKK